MDINFKFEEHTYTAPGSFYDTNRFTLPDGRTIAASGRLETMPPKPQGLHVVAEVAADDRRARTALLAAAHDAQAALKAFEDVMAEHEDAWIGATLALPLMAIRSSVNGTLGMIEGRLPPVERTPEIVLRAMLRAHEIASVDAWRAFYQSQRAQIRAGTVEAAQAVREAHAKGTAADFRRAFVGAALARCLEEGADYETFVVEPMATDYEARLRGDRSLDAPPAEVP